MQDKILTCKDCGHQWVWTIGEQEFYEKQGFTEPKRCKPCRDARKQRPNRPREQGDK